MGSNISRVTREKCIELFNETVNNDEYELIDIILKDVGKAEVSRRHYITVKCNTCGNIFDSSYHNWKSGKRCKRCACKNINKNVAYNTEDAMRIVKERGYIYVSCECENNRSKIIVSDSEGYMYNPRLLDLIRRNGVLSPFKKNNPFTLENIKQYCKNNNTKTTLINDSYESNSDKMKWKCGICGKEFERTWAKFSYYSAFHCNSCSNNVRTEMKKMPIEDVKKIFTNNGLTPLFDKCDNNSHKLKCMFDDGYIGYISYSAVQGGNIPRKFGKENIYTEENIRKYCDDNNISTKLLDVYDGNNKDMKWECGVCGNEYSASWSEFYGRKYHYCCECSNRREMTAPHEAFEFEKLKDILYKNKCVILSKHTPSKVNDKIVYRDENGYMYHSLCSTILKGCRSAFVHPSNPYSIRNIRKFIVSNNINARLISDKYTSSGKNSLELMCECGNTFFISWANLQSRHTSKCAECRKKETLETIRRIDWKQIVEEDTEFEYSLLKVKYPKSAKKEVRLVVKHNECNRIYEVGGYSFKSGSRCRPCAVIKAGIERRDTIEEFKKYVEDVTAGEYECIADFYDVANTPLKMRHNLCGYEYMVSPNSFKNGGEHNDGTRCPKCANLRNVSYTHAILSLLFDRYFCGVEFEYDAGFRTRKNGVSKYDLYVEPLNLLIEWQSKYHDSNKQKQIDKDKELYAKNNGYEFLALDHRSFKTIDYVKMFFPFLEDIPQDLNLDMFNKFNISKAQRLMNSGLTIRQSAEIMNETIGKFYGSIQRGDLQYPDDYLEINRQNKEVVQLSLDGEFVCEYDSIADASRSTGFKSIGLVCSGKALHSGGYVWIYKDKYINNDYILPKKEECVIYGKPVVQLTLDGKKIGEYSSQKDAGDKTGIKAASISAGMKKANGYCNGYVWVYLDDFNSGNYTIPKKRRIDFTIVKLTLDYEYICEYNNLKHVEDECGYTRSNISKAISGKRTSNGFRWMYKDDYDKMISQNN